MLCKLKITKNNDEFVLVFYYVLLKKDTKAVYSTDESFSLIKQECNYN